MRSFVELAVIAGIMALGALPAVAFAAAGDHPSHTPITPGKAKACACVSGDKELLKQHAGG
jgi:hypothetical protein